jgi:hypothetical protein
MKPALFLSAPPLAFFAAVLLAGLLPPHDPATSTDRPIPSGPRKRGAVIEDSKPAPTSIEATLADMEHRVVRVSSPNFEIHDADGMESSLLVDLREAVWGGGGVEANNYSRQWASENPAELFEWLIRQKLVSSDLRKSLAAVLFSEWAKQDIVAALAAISRMNHTESRVQALVSMLEILCEKNPAKARELLLRDIASLEAMESVEFAVFEPGRARTDLILALPPGRLRTMLMAENIRCLMYQGVGCGGDNSSYYAKAAIGTGLWNQLTNDERRELVDAGLRLSDFDEIQLDGLEDLIKQRAEVSNDPGQAGHFIDQYGISWAERDVGAAVSWAMAHLKGEERAEWSLILIEYGAEKDFAAAMRVWRTLPEGTLSNEMAKRLVEVAPADRDAEKALLQDSLPKPGTW